MFREEEKDEARWFWWLLLGFWSGVGVGVEVEVMEARSWKDVTCETTVWESGSDRV